MSNTAARFWPAASQDNALSLERVDGIACSGMGLVSATCRRCGSGDGFAASVEGATVQILEVRISGVCNDRVCDACSGCRLVGIGLVSSRFCRYGLSGPANGRVDCAS